jgi:diguanylate cyclase (GGDEF)-like protein
VRRNDTERYATVSMGLAVSQGVGEDEAENLVQQADVGLYEAKRKGRNRVEYMGSTAMKAQLA